MCRRSRCLGGLGAGREPLAVGPPAGPDGDAQLRGLRLGPHGALGAALPTHPGLQGSEQLVLPGAPRGAQARNFARTSHQFHIHVHIHFRHFPWFWTDVKTDVLDGFSRFFNAFRCFFINFAWIFDDSSPRGSRSSATPCSSAAPGRSRSTCGCWAARWRWAPRWRSASRRWSRGSSTWPRPTLSVEVQ